MAVESGWHWDESFVAGATLATKQFHAVVPNGTTEDSVVVAANQGVDIVGVVQNNPASGQDATVRLLGWTKAIAGSVNAGVIPAWSQVTVAADGRFEVADTGDKIIGVAVSASAAENQIFTLWLRNEPAVV
jgi:hypothetical protein